MADLTTAVKRLTNSPLLMTWYSLTVRIGRGLAVLPVAAIMLDPQDLALWLMLLVVLDATRQAELGLSPALLRATGYYLVGAQRLAPAADRGETGEIAKAPNIERLRMLVGTARVVYLALSLVALPFAVGFVYFSGRSFLGNGTGLDFWLIVAATAMQIPVKLLTIMWSSILQGCGQVAQFRRMEGGNGVAIALCQVVVLFWGGGVLGLMAVQLIGWFSLYVWCIRGSLIELRRLGVTRIPYRPDRATLAELWPISWRMGATSLGSYLIINGPAFSAAQLGSPAVAAAYLLSVRVAIIVRGLANAFLLSALPRAIRMSANQDLVRLREFAAKRIAASLIFLAAGYGAMVLLGNPLLQAIGSNAHFLETGPLLVMVMSFIVSSHAGIHFQIFTTSNSVPMWKHFMVSGMLSSGMVYFFINEYGVYALVLVQFFSVMLIISWHTVLVNLRYLKWSLRDYFVDIICSIWSLSVGRVINIGKILW